MKSAGIAALTKTYMRIMSYPNTATLTYVWIFPMASRSATGATSANMKKTAQLDCEPKGRAKKPC